MTLMPTFGNSISQALLVYVCVNNLNPVLIMSLICYSKENFGLLAHLRGFIKIKSSIERLSI